MSFIKAINLSKFLQKKQLEFFLRDYNTIKTFKSFNNITANKTLLMLITFAMTKLYLYD